MVVLVGRASEFWHSPAKSKPWLEACTAVLFVFSSPPDPLPPPPPSSQTFTVVGFRSLMAATSPCVVLHFGLQTAACTASAAATGPATGAQPRGGWPRSWRTIWHLRAFRELLMAAPSGGNLTWLCILTVQTEFIHLHKLRKPTGDGKFGEEAEGW